MIDYNDRYIREHRFEGMTGLELESQRVTACGNLSHTPHPFPEDEYIDSDSGYWNPFVPVISYEDIRSYIGSMRKYVESGVLIDARELYYPVRIKPAGKYTLRALEEDGVDHIELRMVDINPLADDETDIRDLRFLQMFLIWLSSLERHPLSENDQLTAIYNHKNSALYSWDIAQLYSVTGEPVSLKKGLSQVLERMVQFYSDDTEAYRLLKFQQDKIDNEECRYASIVSKRFGKDYIGEGLRRAREIQDRFNV